MDESHSATETSAPPSEAMQAFGRVAAAWKHNRPNFPLDELEKYRGRFIAWDPDVTKIIAASERAEDIDQAIRDAGYDTALCPVEFIS